MTRRILSAVCVLLMLVATGCGSTYNLKKGGWVIAKDDSKGTCLTVHGDGDPEVVVVCILAAEPIKLPKSVIDAACPKCAECPAPAPAEEKTDGAD
jgi:hypothetical protein